MLANYEFRHVAWPSSFERTPNSITGRWIAKVRGPIKPGHIHPSVTCAVRKCLLAFEEELMKGAESAGFIAAMKARYPNAGVSVALDIGCKVAKGVLKWG